MRDHTRLKEMFRRSESNGVVSEALDEFPYAITGEVVIIATSNGSPASIRFLICVDGSYEMTTLLPVVRSNCGNSSSTTAFTPFVQNTLMSAAVAVLGQRRA